MKLRTLLPQRDCFRFARNSPRYAVLWLCEESPPVKRHAADGSLPQIHHALGLAERARQAAGIADTHIHTGQDGLVQTAGKAAEGALGGAGALSSAINLETVPAYGTHSDDSLAILNAKDF